MNRQSSSYLFGVMAFLTLVMVMVLPLISQKITTPAAASQTLDHAALSPYMQALDRQRSSLIRVDGGVYFRGTLPDEAEKAASSCVANGWSCDASLAEDSYPPHRLRVTTFWMEMTEVNYQQYVSFLNTLGPGVHVNGCAGQLCALTQNEAHSSGIVFNGSSYSTSNPALNDYPVVDVTWYGAQAYCETLGRRLPTEAEWEYAARGPAGTLYPWGNEWADEAANVRGSTRTPSGVVIAGAQPVGGNTAYASRDGIRDLAGNVAEWVADWYAPDHYLQRDPNLEIDFSPSTGTARVIRGGSWNDVPFFARSVQRSSMIPVETSSTVGFRCVADN